MNEPIGRSWGEGGAEGRWEAAGAGGAPGRPSSSSPSSSSSQAPTRTTLGLPRRPLVRSRARRAGRATRGSCSPRSEFGRGWVASVRGPERERSGKKERSPARPPARRLAASPALALRAPRFAGCSSHPRPPPCSLARSFEPVSKPCGAPGRVRGEGPRGQRRAGGGGPGREQPAGEGPCPARAPRGPSAASDRAAWTAACPPPPPGPARALGPGAWSPGRA